VRIVVDSNIIFSALLTKNSSIRNILFSRDHLFFSPNFVFAEIFKYKEKIFKCSRLDEIELYEYLNRILENIQFVKAEVVSNENYTVAYDMCRDIDEKDSPFIALAIEINAFIWTGDKKLRGGLEKKGFIRFVDLELFEEKKNSS